MTLVAFESDEREHVGHGPLFVLVDGEHHVGVQTCNDDQWFGEGVRDASIDGVETVLAVNECPVRGDADGVAGKFPLAGVDLMG